MIDAAVLPSWVRDAVDVEDRRLASLDAGYVVQDEWHRGKYFTPTETVLHVVARERRHFEGSGRKT